MKTKLTLLLLTLALTLTLTLYAQTNGTPPIDGAPLPASKGDFWMWAIAGISPLIVTLIKKVAPKIPKLLLPASTPIIGIGLGIVLNKLGASDLGWVDMAQAGALAVFIRETLDQAVKTVAPGPENKTQPSP